MTASPIDRFENFARTVLATCSVRAACALHTARLGTDEVHLPGFPGPFRFRTGTSDAKFLRVLATQHLPAEYRLPTVSTPQVILDIGANIGSVTAALARRYPGARIFAFEPLPTNYELLAHNVAQFPNVTPLPYGLGAHTASRTYCLSDNPRNFGGGGFYGGQPTDHRRVDALPVVAVPESFAQLGLTRVDLVKIDTEGAEYDILSSFPEPILQRITLIVGELHGTSCDADLLDLLDTWFEVERILRRGRPQWFRALRRQ